jgi:REP element-mobilizing transposase RayT
MSGYGRLLSMTDEPFSAEGWHSRGYLPHFEGAAIQAVTFRLADTLPQSLLERWKADSPEQPLNAEIDRWLDQGRGDCWLGQSAVAQIVEDCLLRFDGQRYRLLAWVIMPNHVHLVVECFGAWPLRGEVQGWKSTTAHAINRLLGRKGAFWYPDYYDRFIRDERHLAAAIEYVHQNPVKAGLVATAEAWRFSSARRM